MAKQVIALLSVIARIVHFLAECEFAMQQFYPIVQLILNFIIEQGCFDEKNNFIGKKRVIFIIMLSSYTVFNDEQYIVDSQKKTLI